MNRLIALLTVMVSCVFFPVLAPAQQKEDKSKLQISATVRDKLTKRELVGAKVRLTDKEGNMVDTCTADNIGMIRIVNNNYEMEKNAKFNLKVPREGGQYILEAEFDGYAPYSMPITVKKAGGREFTRVVGDILMGKAPKNLDGITVTASKIKFYNRGDTLVFNADAFELAEGSMLDGLIKQLPGVEIKQGGQIYVNGEFVENLLLNGKEFFKGNNEIMLDNIAAYTVKNVEVYKKQTDMDKFLGSKKEGDLTLDVKLKREYNQGWLFNFEAGMGTSDRYLGRAFINRFTDNTRLTLVGNVNNLNDNRKPGESNAWTPESNTVGTMKTQMAALDYNVTNPKTNFKANGYVQFRHSSQHDRRDVNRINFLTGGNTYDYTFGRNGYNELLLSTYHNLSKQKQKKISHNGYVSAYYQRRKSNSSNNGVSMREENPTVTSAWIDSLYTSGFSGLDEIINRTVTRTLNSSRNGSFNADYFGAVYIPGTDDNISYDVTLDMTDSKNEIWRDYTVNYGANPVPAVRQRQYFDNSPNRRISTSAKLTYSYAVSKEAALRLTYQFNYAHQDKDSYMYSLDRLNDMDIFGTLPEGYLSTLNAANSYRSSVNQRQNTVILQYSYWSDNLQFSILPNLRIHNNDLRYFRNDRNYAVAQHATVLYAPSYSCFINWYPGEPVGTRKIRPNRFMFQAGATPTLPDMYRMVDMTDDTDPMNIWVGNPDLKTAYSFNGQLAWMYTRPTGSNAFRAAVRLEATFGHNNIVNGYTYDLSTGVRTNKAYNVGSGNRTLSADLGPNWQFGSKQQFTLSYIGRIQAIRSADMIGTNVEIPEKSTVNTLWNNHTAEFSWQIGKQTLAAKASFNKRHTSSDRQGFNAINATEGVYQVRGMFKLPQGFGINTDVTLYARRGYGSKELDTTDPVWNMALSWTPRKSRFVFMVDGFDMLHRLSNVNYAVNAQGRTVTFRNVLPRYIMFHVQYRLNIQPKKKVVETIKTGNVKDLWN